MSSRAPALDATAIGLSLACIVHCLALPVLAAFLPFFASWAEAEWVHRVLVLLALPVTLFALARSRFLPPRRRRVFVALALGGLALLFAAAFVEALHDVETALTLVGAVLLASAHGVRLTSHPPLEHA